MVAIDPRSTRTSPDIAGEIHRFRVYILSAGAFVIGLFVALRLRPVVLLDDAAITARYVTRLVNGDGWTYNPGDQTNGASAPLYTMTIAALHAIGIDVLVAMRLVGYFCYAASVALCAYLGAKISGMVAGVFAAAFLLLWFDFAMQGLSGMESAFSAVLGLCVVVALLHRSDTWTGVFLGLALLNKLDAGMLALAVTAAYLIFYRRPPWRIAAISAAILGPWLLFSTIYFGSPLPNSFTQKVSGQLDNASNERSNAWVFDSLRAQRALWVIALGFVAIAVIPYVLRRNRPAAVALATAVAWPLLHALTFSVLDLGDTLPWYLTVLYPPIAIAAGCALGTAVQLARPHGTAATIAALAGVLVVAGLVTGASPNSLGQTDRLTTAMGDTPVTNEYLQFELARRTAGARVDELTEPGDVVATCFGWIAFEAEDTTIRETCPLNTRDETAEPDWFVSVSYPGDAPPELSPDMELVETIYADNSIGGRVDIIRYR